MNRKERNDGKKNCPHCNLKFQRLDKHTPVCKSNPEVKVDQVPCPYCHQKFQRLDMHTPYCKLKPDDDEDLKNNGKQLSTDEGQDEGDRKKRCPYCDLKFQRLDMHTPYCKLKPSSEEDLVPCPYCHQMFQRIDMHKPYCKLKPDDEENLKNNEKQLSTDERGCKVAQELCPFCHEKCQDLNEHIRHCPSKPDDEEDVENNEKQLSTDDCDEDLCRGFQRFDIKKPDYRSKGDDQEDLKKNENKMSTYKRQGKDDRKNLCQNFQRLNICKPKSDAEEDLKNNKKQLSIDDSDVEDDGKKRCGYCHKMFKRLDVHKKCCKKNPVSKEFSCQYCNDKFVHVQLHECKCRLQPHGERNFKDIAKSVIVKRNDNRMKIVNDTTKRIKDYLNDTMDKDDLSWDVLNTGSYYSLVKVSDANEFDYMFCPTLVQCRIEPNSDHPCHCKVFITNKEKLPDYFTDILESSGEIIPSKYKDFCFKVFDSIVENKRHFERVTNDSSSPAYTIEYKYKTQKKRDTN